MRILVNVVFHKNAQSSALRITPTNMHTITHHQIPYRPLLANDGISNKHVCGEESCRVIWKLVQHAAGCSLFPAQQMGLLNMYSHFYTQNPLSKTTLYCNMYSGI